MGCYTTQGLEVEELRSWGW